MLPVMVWCHCWGGENVVKKKKPGAGTEGVAHDEHFEQRWAGDLLWFNQVYSG